MRDPQAVELRRQPGQLELDLPQPHPARLEPAPAEPGRRNGPDDGSGAATVGHHAGNPPSVTHADAAPAANLSAWSDLEPLERRPRIDDMPLELQLGVLEACRDADELREVEDRQLERLSRRLLELLLPCVEREVAERARRHHHVGPRFERLLDWLDQLAERGLLARLDDREAAALDLRRVVDRLSAAGFDDALERPRPVRILE